MHTTSIRNLVPKTLKKVRVCCIIMKCSESDHKHQEIKGRKYSPSRTLPTYIILLKIRSQSN
jgi:hypothetical protein